MAPRDSAGGASAPGVRALVLAAGLGTRLRPLTEAIPKPLLPVTGETVAGLTLDRLAALGCELAVLNLHHRGEQIAERFGERRGELALTYSREPELLGTLGALAPVGELLAAASEVLLINGDSLCRWPLKRLLRRHRKSGARATLLLSSRADPQRYGGGVAVDKSGRILSFRPGGPSAAGEAGRVHRRLVFAGAHVLDPGLVASAERRPLDIVTDLYEPLLVAGAHLQGVVTRRPWHDLGTPLRYLEGVLYRARHPWTLPIPLRRNWVSPAARVASEAQLRRAVVEAGAQVAAGARIEDAVLLAGSTVGPGAEIRRAILGPGVEISAGSRVQGRLVTAVPTGWQPGPRDTRIGGHAFTPLDP